MALAFEALAQTSTSPSGAHDKAEAAASADANHAGMNPLTGNVSSPPAGDSKTLEQIEHPLAYPPEALEKGIQGKVVVKVSILETGAVESVEPVSGDPILTNAAVEAVKQWKFKPFIRDGKAIKSRE